MPTIRSLVVAPALLLATAVTVPARAQGPTSTPGAAPATLRLARLFADGMVLQRGSPIPVWGWAPAGAPVTVTMRGHSARATASAAGAWRATLPAAPAGGPYAITVAGAGANVMLRDVLVGDVWVASGQSNMELTLARATGGTEAAAAAHDSGIRELKVPTGWSWTPERDLAGGAWSPADPAHAGDLSAVAYFFARDLRAAEHVPIGIVNTTWGGSAIEAWTEKGAQGLSGPAWAAIEAREKGWQAAMLDTLTRRVGAPLPTVDAGLVNGRAAWADPALDESSWKTLPVPGLWESAGYAGLDGVAWYRTTVTLTDAQARSGGRLSLGTVDDDDQTWVNGTAVGATKGYNVPRSYAVPAGVLHAGANVIAVRVADYGGGGGLTGPAESLYLEVGDAKVPLAGSAWRFRVGQVMVGEDGQHVNKIPTVLYNRMVAPLVGLPIKGVIWYQGESNADRDEQAAAYRAQFATMITSWRAAWGRGDVPFLWVQLPNFGAVDTVPPARANWATMRESQAAALRLPRTGQAVTIDVGEPGDIHPKDKLTVGHRLALVARRVAYGEAVVAAAPAYRSHVVQGNRVVITLDGRAMPAAHASPDSLPGFAIAGADRRFVWARARVDGNRVTVWSDAVKSPVAVRYLYGDSPRAAGLYGPSGLPVAPFRTDAW